MKKYIENLLETDKEFNSIIYPIIKNETVQEMKKYRQHYETSCFEHCLTASYYCYKICKKFNLDYKSASRAAMLHDLFLYDWRKKQDGRTGLHAFTHGKTACKNASKLFDLSDKEKDIILKHMWPVTIAFPKSIEGFVLTVVDKYCAVAETSDVFQNRILNKKILRYAYLFLSLLIINI